MALLSYFYYHGIGTNADGDSRLIWAKKALSSSDKFAIGFCHQFGLGTAKDIDISRDYLQASVQENDEFGCLWFAYYNFSQVN